MYTLWLMPSGETYQRLNQLIVNLSSIHQTPVFEPHVTLLSGIANDEKEALKLTEELAQNLKPIKATLTRIEYLEMYYRCLFFRTDESQQLFDARDLAEDLFEHANVQPFIPHISFLYGALPIFQKQEIIQELGDDFFIDFELSELRLVKTEDSPEEWEVLMSISL